ncbi:UNVERIFIED_CONTAM: hypothetical protein Sradi_7086800 [Sesamum radiatum]|uniref:DUF3719 domain-containing protein n=1 Tax=Sesamum radiatum TaxID=300843 RepID=A0AAW2J591_SESRA
MLPKGPNSLCPLSHSSHTDSTHTTHTEILTTHSCGEPEAPVLGGDSPSVDEAEHPGGASAIPEDSSSNLNGDFDFDEFYELATRVLNGDSESLTSLQALKIRWELKFKTRRNPLKPVIGRPSTPFRPRISLLPRRFVRTDLETLPAPNVETSNILDGDSRSSELEIHGRSSPQSGPDSQEQVLQEAQLGDLMDQLARPRVHLPKVKHPKKQRLPQIVMLRLI